MLVIFFPPNFVLNIGCFYMPRTSLTHQETLLITPYTAYPSSLTHQETLLITPYPSYPSYNFRFLYAQIAVEMVKSFLSTVGNALARGVFVLRKILKLKFHLELARAVF